MNYSEMSDFEIDVAVAGIIHPGRKITNFAGEAVVWFGNLETRIVRYCNSWTDAGPIIGKENISLIFGFGHWDAMSPDGDSLKAEEVNPLRAAMIVFLMMQEQPNA